MSRLTDAIRALEYVKQHIPLDRSDNKFIRQDRSNLAPLARQQARAESTARVTHVRTHPQFPTRGQTTGSDIVGYGRYALDAGHGNCLEMSCAAVWYLNQVGRFDYDLVYYPDGDHVFVVLRQSRDYQGRFPQDFADWDAEAVICDVWADIVCPAREYPARWRARMDNWRIMGLTLANLMPTHAKWFDIVDDDKSSYLAA